MNIPLQIAKNTEYKMCFLQYPSNLVPEEKDYAFVLVPVNKMPDLQQAKQSIQFDDLEKYGIIVESGTGNPSQAVIDCMKREFQCEF